MSTWILVADSSRARFFSQENNKAPLLEVGDLIHPEGRLHESELVSDRPGRAFDSNTPGRHAMEAPMDIKKQELIKFCDQLVAYLEKADKEHAFAELILVAPPEFLGEFRKKLAGKVKQRITREISKNLTQHSVADIRQHLITPTK